MFVFVFVVEERNHDIVSGFARKHDEYKHVIRNTTHQENFISRPYHKFFLLFECRVLLPLKNYFDSRVINPLFIYKYKNKERKQVQIILEEE